MTDRHAITTLDALERLYDKPSERALLKQRDRLDAASRAFIAASPFLILATSGGKGGDCTPRGDQPGFVEIADDETLLLPDRRGNNRIDSLRNIVENPAVALLFLVPGTDQTLRVNGRAEITVDPALIERLTFAGKPPKSVLRITIDEVFVQCPRALLRAALWNPASVAGADAVPSMGTLLEAATQGRVDAARYDAEDAPRTRQVLY
ncbi:MAG: pyridoxamine 5'-phosphate oxidase family protein [Stellaceae bacterium]